MNNNLKERLLWMGMIVGLSLGLDQATKRIAEHTLIGDRLSFFYDTFRLEFVKNSGAFLGLGSNYSPSVKMWLFFILPAIFLVAACWYLIATKHLSIINTVMFAFIISGGLGNMIDRLFMADGVTDFMNMGIGPVRTGIFNMADVFIMTGAIGLVLFQQKKPQPTAQEQ